MRLTHLKSSTLLMIFYPYQRHISPEFDFTFCDFTDMSAIAFIEPLPIIEFVAQLLNSEIYSKPLSDAERVRVFSLN